MTLSKLLSYAYRIDYENCIFYKETYKNKLYKKWDKLPNYKKIEFVKLFRFVAPNDETYYLNKSNLGWNINKPSSESSTFVFSKEKFMKWGEFKSGENITTDFFLCLDIIDKALESANTD